MKRNVRKRLMANERERERTKSLNQALEVLRDRLPAPEAEKRSKIQTLKMAKLYIEFLTKCKQMAQQQQQQQDEQNQIVKKENGRQAGSNCQQQSQSKAATLDFNHSTPLTFMFYKFRVKSQSGNEIVAHSKPPNQ